MTRISVAMATYNGGAFVDDQIESVLDQSRPPDEVVISDDGSEDDTIERLRAWAARSPGRIRVLDAHPRLGVTKNFENAIAAVTGDMVALADQDDVWHPEKLAVTEELLASGPSVSAVFSDARLVDGDGLPLGRSLLDTGNFTRSERRLVARGRVFEALLRGNFVTGATLAFRATLRPVLLPLPPDGLHDVWIALVASALGTVHLVNEPLIDYRIHGANVLGVPSRNPLRVLRQRLPRANVRTDELAHFQAALERLSDVLDERSRDQLEHKIKLLRFREQISAASPQARAIPVLARLARGEYHRYARGFRSAVFDLGYG